MSDPRLEPPPTGPSAAASPVIETLPAGTRLWRVHRASHQVPGGRVEDDGTLFNPGVGPPTRFAPLTSVAGAPVPTMYAGASRRGALFESVLHDQMPMSVVDARRWVGDQLTALTLASDLDVVSLHGPGLRSLGLFAADITQTYPSDYPRATRWAQWLHTHTAAAGLAWSSKQDDDERAYVLWGGDRVPDGALVPETPAPGGHGPLLLGFGDGLDWAKGVAASVRIEVIG